MFLSTAAEVTAHGNANAVFETKTNIQLLTGTEYMVLQCRWLNLGSVLGLIYMEAVALKMLMERTNVSIYPLHIRELDDGVTAILLHIIDLSRRLPDCYDNFR